jgi:Tfp pilus assembly protein PilX
MGTNRSETGRRRGESGFALIMAILALMLLTFLGLTMASISSTELQIGANQRLTMQAYYNAEAGIEAGKHILRDADWNTVLPAKRAVTWTLPTNTVGAPAPPIAMNDAWGNASRNWEPDGGAAGGGGCDQTYGHQGYGAILYDGTAEAPYQYKSTMLGVDLNGTVTLWVRRATRRCFPDTVRGYPPLPCPQPASAADGSYVDDEISDNLVLTAEGTAPTQGQFRGGGAGVFARMRDATQVIEVLLNKNTAAATPCGTRAGQTSQGPEGAGFGCTPVTEASVSAAVGAAGGVVGGSGVDTGVK